MLDDYSGTEAAYSLALLNSDYEGNCVTVRRASDNATQNIGFDGQDLDIAALESFCSGTNGFVTTWYDQSGNANNAVQTTASSQPQIVSSGSVILENGKAAMSYDGVDDCFETSNLTNYTDPAFLAFVGQVDTFPSAVIGKLSGVNRGLGFTIDDVRYRVYREAFGANDHATTSVGTSQLLVDFQMINGVTNLYKNTIAVDNPQNVLEGLTFDGDTNGIGINFASQYYDGKMQTIVLYHTNESSNRTGIETALNDYYSIY